MPSLELPEELQPRLLALAERHGVTPTQYAGDLLKKLLRLPDPLDWLTRLERAAYDECRAALAASKSMLPSEEAIPAFLPLSVIPTQDPFSGSGERNPQPWAPEDSLAIILELLAVFYLDLCAQDPAQPRTGEIADLETCLAERYFYCLSFAELRRGVLVSPESD